MRVTLNIRSLFAIICTLLIAGISQAQTTNIQLAPMVQGLDSPWGFGFLPNGDVLITEKGGALILARDDSKRVVQGVPKVAVIGQGGLLDVMIPKDFAQSRQVYLSYVVAQTRGYGTAMGVGKLSNRGTHITDFKQLFEMKAQSGGGRHFGSRLAEAPDGTIFMTIGDRGDPNAAQDIMREHGSVLRFNRDGSVPSDNPIKDSLIWSSGHRNPQGLAFGPDGRLWGIEHGAKGGDEINRIAKSRNYGWPRAAYGTNYDGSKIGEGTHARGTKQPFHYWDPSIAPSGAMVYSGKLWPKWAGKIFTGSLKFDQIHIVATHGKSEEVIQTPETQRVRDVREAPDGAIWFLNEPDGILYRMTPKT